MVKLKRSEVRKFLSLLVVTDEEKFSFGRVEKEFVEIHPTEYVVESCSKNIE